MKKFNKNLIGIFLAITLVFGFNGATVAHADLAPGFLGLADTYSVWGATGITGGAASTAWGSAGENGTGNDGSLTPNVADYHTEDQSATVGVDITSAHTDLGNETLTQITPLDLDVPNTVGPGVYAVGTTFTAHLTLHGAGTYIFKGASSITQSSLGSMTLEAGACASNVYWYAGSGAMTFAAGGNIEGTIITNTAITFADSSLTLKGRALAGSAVTLGGITITEPICSADLSITKTVDVATPDIGGTIVYNVTVTNGGPDTATDVAVTDLLPAGLSYVSNVPSQGTYISSTGVWTVGAIANGASKTLAITATVDTGTGGDTIINTAGITASNETDSNLANNEISRNVVVNTPLPVPPVVRRSSSGSSVMPIAPVFEPTINILSTPVVVAPIIPKLPKTGFAPQESGIWYQSLLNNILNLFK